MNRAPSRAAIYAAELRVGEAKRATRENAQRARTALRERLAQPTTLIAVFAASAAGGFLLARRNKQTKVKVRYRSSADSAKTAAASTSIAGLVLAFAMRYAMERAPALVQAVWTARQKRVAGRAQEPSSWQAAGYPATRAKL